MKPFHFTRRRWAFPVTKQKTVEDQHVKTAFFQVGQTKIELLESTTPDGTVAKFIDKRGEGLHHLALAVEDLPTSLADASGQGVRLIDKSPRKGADNLNIAFLHPKIDLWCPHGAL